MKITSKARGWVKIVIHNRLRNFLTESRYRRHHFLVNKMVKRKKAAKRKPIKASRKVRKHGRLPGKKGKASKVRKLKRLAKSGR
jgi:hypothetical protein